MDIRGWIFRNPKTLFPKGETPVTGPLNSSATTALRFGKVEYFAQRNRTASDRYCKLRSAGKDAALLIMQNPDQRIDTYLATEDDARAIRDIEKESYAKVDELWKREIARTGDTTLPMPVKGYELMREAGLAIWQKITSALPSLPSDQTTTTDQTINMTIEHTGLKPGGIGVLTVLTPERLLEKYREAASQ
jgi:hypothetical protein